jgi:hypothetical protein
MITNALTTIGCIYLTCRVGARNAIQNRNASIESKDPMPVALTDSFVTGYTSMAMIAGCLAAPIPSAVLGAGMMARDAYVHREKIANAANWCAKKLRKRESATIHTLRSAS